MLWQPRRPVTCHRRSTPPRLRLATLTGAQSHEDRMRALSAVQRHAVDDITALLRMIDDAAVIDVRKRLPAGRKLS